MSAVTGSRPFPVARSLLWLTSVAWPVVALVRALWISHPDIGAGVVADCARHGRPQVPQLVVSILGSVACGTLAHWMPQMSGKTLRRGGIAIVTLAVAWCLLALVWHPAIVQECVN
jgi:hypothetical protein